MRFRQPSDAHSSDEFLTTNQVAAHLGFASVTLEKWRNARMGPPFLRLGRAIRYRRADLEQWLASQTVTGQ